MSIVTTVNATTTGMRPAQDFKRIGAKAKEAPGCAASRSSPCPPWSSPPAPPAPAAPGNAAASTFGTGDLTAFGGPLACVGAYTIPLHAPTAPVRAEVCAGPGPIGYVWQPSGSGTATTYG